MAFYGIYPLVNQQLDPENHPLIFMGINKDHHRWQYVCVYIYMYILGICSYNELMGSIWISTRVVIRINNGKHKLLQPLGKTFGMLCLLF